MSKIVSPLQIAESLTELWSPRVVAEVDDSYVKVAKVHGSLTWHSHEHEDELFLVLKGRLRIEMEDHAVELGEGEPTVITHKGMVVAKAERLLKCQKSILVHAFLAQSDP